MSMDELDLHQLMLAMRAEFAAAHAEVQAMREEVRGALILLRHEIKEAGESVDSAVMMLNVISVRLEQLGD
jgi:hypothetical protein